MSSPIGWDVGDRSGAWVDLFATFARSQAIGGDPRSAPVWRGEDDVVPRRPGRVASVATVDEGRVTIPIVLRGAQSSGAVATDQEAAFLDNWRALERLVYRRGGFQLRRRLRYPSGVVNHVAFAKVLPGSLTPGMVSTFHGRCVLELAILSGYFYDETPIAPSIPGTVVTDMDDETRAINLVLPGAGTLTNSTMGVSLTTTVATSLDVQNHGATAGINTLTWSGDSLDHFFALQPGSNVITWSGGGAPTMSYSGAHL